MDVCLKNAVRGFLAKTGDNNGFPPFPPVGVPPSPMKEFDELANGTGLETSFPYTVEKGMDARFPWDLMDCMRR